MPEETAPSTPKHSEVETQTINIPQPDRYIYSNVAALSHSQYDVRLILADARPGGVSVDTTGLVMTPEAAAALGMALVMRLITYEKSFGPIRNDDWTAFKNREMKNSDAK